MRYPAMGMMILFSMMLFIPFLLPRTGTAATSDQYLKVASAHIVPHKGKAVTGSGFLRRVAGLDEHQRENAILDMLLQGNIPDFLRHLKPVTLSHALADGHIVEATFFVMPDYLAIGTDSDFVRMPMNMMSAGQIAARFGCVLPTCKMVDAIYAQSDFHYKPQPMTPGPQMRSTAYYSTHNRKIQAQRLSAGIALGTLVAGHKKDVVITNRLLHKRDRIAIYGWHQLSGTPIQPLSTVHGAGYADYSHGIRLVSDTVLIDGTPRSLCQALEDPRLAPVFSDEGPIQHVRWMMQQPAQYFSRRSSADHGQLQLQ